MDLAVVRHHALQAELARPRFGQRHANEAATVFGHEVYRLGRDFRSGHDQIALVFALGVVGHDDHAAGLDIFDHRLDGIEKGFAHDLSVKQHNPAAAIALRESLESAAASDRLLALKTMRIPAPLILLAALLVLPVARAAESYIIVDDETGHILDSSGANEKRQIASLTKIAAAMVALDWATATNSSMATEVEVPAAIAGIGGENPCGLQPGDRVSLRDLVYAALMQSDNHAAYTLAYNVGAKLPNSAQLDPTGNFTAHMNALARKLRMKKTLFLNPHGIDNMENPPYSTATDLARLTRYAGDNAAFNFAVSQTSREITITAPDGTRRAYQLQNTNQLLGQEGIDGVKTGRTARAGDCVILSSDREPQAVEVNGQKMAIPRRIKVVVLGSPDRFGEGLGLVRRGWDLHDKWTAEGRPVAKRTSL